MIITNLFPFRMTDSKLLHTVDDLYGEIAMSNQIIINAVSESDITVCGWGSHALALPRAKDVIGLLKDANLADRIKCLQTNQDGNPQHPLYIKYSQKPVPYTI